VRCCCANCSSSLSGICAAVTYEVDDLRTGGSRSVQGRGIVHKRYLAVVERGGVGYVRQNFWPLPTGFRRDVEIVEFPKPGG
jgi:hypothetical protein